MSGRLFFGLVSLAAAIVAGAAMTSLHAAPMSKAASSLPSTEPSRLTKVDYRCGWDYACPPRPSYGQRSYRTPQVYIENNYGTVNVYRTPRRNYRRHAHSSWRWRERDDDDGRAYDDWRGYKRCGGDSCGESCGIVCWYRRIRDGYCGHGCETYREQARYERDYPDCRDDDCPRYRDADYRRYRDADYRRYRDDDYRRPSRYWTSRRERYDDAPPVRFERPRSDERIPLRLYSGPKYPRD
jgi:hypothetical protein